MEGFSQITSGHSFLSNKSYEKEKDHCTAGKKPKLCGDAISQNSYHKK